ncbi:unnamed protein product [Brassica rapa subsp. trilocularis]
MRFTSLSISFYINRFLEACCHSIEQRDSGFVLWKILMLIAITEKSVMVLSGSRGFCYTLELKNEQEAKQMKKKKIRTHFHAILLTGGC